MVLKNHRDVFLITEKSFPLQSARQSDVVRHILLVSEKRLRYYLVIETSTISFYLDNSNRTPAPLLFRIFRFGRLPEDRNLKME
ncbi:hypothetical protein DW095_02715 [Bacteroides sp. AM07-16]|nr:hypothetical protein DW095_02715 [Bacteroides sp. AM07-16]